MKEAMSIEVHVLFQQKPSPHFLVGWEKASLSWLTFEQVGSALFSRHAESGYGTFLEVVVQSGKPMWKLSMVQAMTWLFHLKAHQDSEQSLWTLQWREDTEAWRVAALRCWQVIQSGWYRPDKAEVRWKLWEEEEDVSSWIKQNNILTEGKVRLQEMLNGIVRELISSPGPVQQAWKDVTKLHPAAAELTPVQTRKTRNREPFRGWDEGWLEHIGFQHGDVPFRIGIRVEETHAEGTWRMTPVLVSQEQESGGMIYACTPEGNQPEIIDERPFPSAWLEMTREIVPRTVAKWRKYFPDFTWRPNSAQLWKFFEQEAPQLEAEGYPVYLPKWWQQAKQVQPKLIANIHSRVPGKLGMDALLSYDWKISLGDQQFTETEFREMMQHPGNMIQVDDQWVPLHPSWLKRIEQVIKRQKNGINMAQALVSHWSKQAADEDHGLSEVHDEPSIDVQIRLNEAMQQMVRDLEQRKTVTELQLPTSLHNTLRPYQQTGASWLLSLRSWGFGACLADDMGLGKTVQCIAYMTHLKQSGESKGPFLLVCPTSVLGNWQKELQRFAPELEVYLHYGTRRHSGKQFMEKTNQADIVLTSYVLANLDRTVFQSREWDAVVLDEAHYIKNPHSKQSIAVRKLQANHRIAMTGTPVENRLSELWSIFDFINPGYLGRLRTFQEQYIYPIEQQKDQQKISRLQRMVGPFLLRRTKQDRSIALSLPKLQENKTYVPLTPEQAVLYEQTLDRMMGHLQPSTQMRRRGVILASLQQLKRICNHPALFLREPSGSHDVEEWAARSHKAERLIELVEEIQAKQEKCLIFTQYVEMGRMIADVLGKISDTKIPFMYGGTPKEERDRMIATFQEEDVQAAEGHGVFVLSLKTGGTGLNLTAANHVLHYDRWWNPAVENQATDRVYRIGQTRDVQVHKFIAMGTLEERIDEMLTSKLELSESVIGTGEKWITELTDSDIKDLFALQRDWL